MKTSLIDYLMETVRRVPERVAVWDNGRELTFVQLWQRAAAVSRKIHEAAPGKGGIVAVYLPKCAEVTVADFAILMAGHGFMNLDVHTPTERIAEILKNVEPPVILTDAKGAQALGTLEQTWVTVDVTVIESEEGAVPEDRWHYYGHRMIDADPFCIINTSGSTGVPKSVVSPFRSFLWYAQWAVEEGHFERDVESSASISPVFFDIYVTEVMLLALIGMRQVLVPDAYRLFPAKILQVMQEQKTTWFFWVPTTLVNIANANIFEHFPLPELKGGWLSGEVCPPKQLNQWIRAYPHVAYVNLYGLMEIAVTCTHYEIPGVLDEQKSVPVGKAIDNYDLLLVREDGTRIDGPGEEGEICVRGSILAFGYYALPEKTHGVFRQVPWNTKYDETMYHTGDYGSYDAEGNILFAGRRDSLVKHSGYRIELAEIEHAVVNTAALARNACVVYDHQAREIVLFYEADADLDMGVVRRELAKCLPKYMLPTRFHRMEALPRGGTGKIDRALLNRQVNG